jgi:predicted dehydrogenase
MQAVPPSTRPLRIGVLGAARITPMALLRPARALPEVQVAAVAARDPERAAAFARRHGIPRVHASYAELIADPEIDAIYNPLPNSHHCEWSVRALEAGRHVLCEKPIAANAREARQMAETADATGLVLMEAFHWRYHPLAERMRAIVASGVLGRLRHIETRMCVPMLAPGNIRYRLDLAGGALMDVGAYTLDILRFLAGGESPEVVAARAWLSSPQVDRRMEADFVFAAGHSGRIVCSLFSRSLLRVDARVVGDDGEMSVLNPVAPHVYHHLRLRTRASRSRERVAGEATYTGQLRAFARAVRTGEPVSSDARSGLANMRLIDAIYAKAGLPARAAPAGASQIV